MLGCGFVVKIWKGRGEFWGGEGVFGVDYDLSGGIGVSGCGLWMCLVIVGLRVWGVSLIVLLYGFGCDKWFVEDLVVKIVLC